MKNKVLILILSLLFLYTVAQASSLQEVSPRFEWCETVEPPSIENVEFAAETLEYFLGENYRLRDNFLIDIAYQEGIVRFMFDQPYYDGDFLLIVFNPVTHYYVTPIIINNCMICDFSNITPNVYEIYIFQSSIKGAAEE